MNASAENKLERVAQTTIPMTVLMVATSKCTHGSDTGRVKDPIANSGVRQEGSKNRLQLQEGSKNELQTQGSENKG